MPPLTTTFANAIYRAGATRRRFEREHPHEPVLAAGATKAIRDDHERPYERGTHWIAARRATVLATSERLICRDWEVLWSDVSKAEMMCFRSVLSQGMLLKISTKDGKHYQFGLGHDDAWTHLPVEIDRAENTLGHSPFSLVVRLLLLAMITWLLLDRYVL